MSEPVTHRIPAAVRKARRRAAPVPWLFFLVIGPQKAGSRPAAPPPSAAAASRRFAAPAVGREEAARIFRAYIAARNRHDPEGAAALTAREIRAFDAQGKPHPFDEKRLRDVLAWEAGMNARWSGRELAWDGRYLEVEASEENDLYDALGVGAAVQRDRIRVENERIVEWYGLGERATGRGEEEALSEFEAWARALPGGIAEGALHDGRLVVDARGAAKLRPLLDRWRRERRPAAPGPSKGR